MRIKPQKGFTGIEIVLVIVTVAALSFAGWTWWSAQQTNQANNIEQTTNTSAETKAGREVPEGWQEYRNQELGVSFLHPKSWGEVTYKRQHLSHPEWEKNLPHNFVFSNEKAPVVIIVPDNWELNPPGQGNWNYPLDRERLEEYVGPDSKSSFQIANRENLIAVMYYDGYDGNVRFEGLSSQDLPKMDADQVELRKAAWAEEMFKDGCLVNREVKGSLLKRKCYSQEYRDNFVDTLASFKEI